jgi:hypothetical protein
MKWLLGAIAAVLLAGPASAYELVLTIPSGPGLTRLAQLCDWLRADPGINKPAMTNEECGMRLFLVGAFALNHEKLRIELRAQGKADLQAGDAAFRSDLPMPPNAPTPTPTATPTATSTAIPTPGP